MSNFLPLADHLLSRGRLLLRLGRTTDARRLFRRVLGHPDLSNQVRADVLHLLAGIELDAGRYRRARRYLAAAIRLCRHAEELYVEYARATLADPDADPRLAVKALRRAVGIDLFESRSWAALGSAAMQAGDNALARKAFRRAARLRPEHADTLQDIANGFLALGRESEARELLTDARFRAPNDAGVTAVWDQFRFAQAVRQQRRARREVPAILPFPVAERKTSRPVAAGPVVLRADRKSAAVPHLLRFFGRRTDPRQAQ